MHSLTLTIRPTREGNRVIAEISEPGLATGGRRDEPFVLDPRTLPALRTGATHAEDLLQYGRQLGEAVFTGSIAEAFQAASVRADAAGDVLHLLLSVEDPPLLGVRWERLCARIDGHWQFVRLQQRTPFSLFLPSENDKRYPAISRADLRALVVVANLGPTRPFGLAEFDAAATVAQVRAALGGIPATVLACDGVRPVAGTDGLPTLDAICERITNERPTLLHVVCHGMYRAAEQETFLFLHQSGEADSNRPDAHVHRVSATQWIARLRTLQAARGLPHLTFLSSCDTAAPEAETALGGLGQRLVRELGMPAVIAMTEAVDIGLAGQLSTAFYQRLLVQGAVDRALDEACAALAGHGHVLVPALFSRLAGRKLFDDFGLLTVGQWEQGLQRVADLLARRAPTLTDRFTELAARVRPALAIRRQSESAQPSEDSRRATETIVQAQKELNELCLDFLDNTFDHVAKGLPLAIPDYDGRCPFPGLAAFDRIEGEDFRPFFFGREAVTEELRQRLAEHRFVAVLGGSGSGKSSLVRAGLLDAMRKRQPELKAIVFPPGPDPSARLRAAMETTPDPDVVVVDQFEELFTLVREPADREAFLERLLALRKSCRVVITMRADFLGECAEHDRLHALLDAGDQHLKIIQPLRGHELREVMERQANEVGLRFEPGLAQKIFEEIEGEPGAMPLLQHCLRQLWHYRHGCWLRLVDYVDDGRVGGVKGAIARTAEDAYRRLSQELPAAATLVPFIFERLTKIDASRLSTELRRDTRQPELLSQLVPAGYDPDEVKRIVNRLCDAKLLVTSFPPESPSPGSDRGASADPIVQVAHEAIIGHWPTLRSWIERARVNSQMVEQIRRGQANYQQHPLGENLSLRGVNLAAALDLLSAKPPRLTAEEERFVRACQAAEQAERTKETNRLKQIARLTTATAAVLGLLLIGTAISFLVVRAARRDVKEKLVRMSTISAIAARERNDVVTAAHHFMTAADNLEVAAKASQLRNAARHLIRPIGLTATFRHDQATGCLPLPTGDATLTWGQEGLQLWNAAGVRSAPLLRHPETQVLGVVLAPEARRAVAWDLGGSIRIWDLSAPVASPKTMAHPSVLGVSYLAADRIVSWAYDGTIRCWNPDTGEPLTGQDWKLEGNLTDSGMHFSPAGSRLFAFTDRDSLLLNLDAPATEPVRGLQASLEPETLRGAKFLEEERLAVWGDSPRIDLTNPRQPDAKIFFDCGGQISEVDFDPKTSTLLVSTRRNQVEVWSLADPQVPARSTTIDHGSEMLEGMKAEPSTQRLATWDRSGTVRLWEISDGSKVVELSHPTLTGIAMLPGPRLATWGNDGTAMIWDLADPRPPNLVGRLHHGKPIDEVSGFGPLIFTRDLESGMVKRWEIQPHGPTVLEHPAIAGFAVDATEQVVTWGQGPAETVADFPSSLRVTRLASTAAPIREWLSPNQVIGCQWLSSGELLASCDNGQLRRYPRTGEPEVFEIGPGLFRLSLSPDQRHAAAMFRRGPVFETQLLRLAPGEINVIARFESKRIDDAMFRGTHDLLLCTDSGIYRADFAEGESPIEFVRQSPEGFTVGGGRFASDGQRALIWDSSGTLAVWQAGRLEAVDAKLSKDSPGASFAMDGNQALAWDRSRVLLIDVASRQAFELPFHGRNTLGGRIAAERILSWSENELRLSTLRDRKPLTSLAHGRIGRYESAVLFSPDERWILSCGDDQTAKLWDAENGDLLLVCRHPRAVKFARFLPGEDRFITLSDGDQLAVWDLSAGGEFDVRRASGTSLDASGRLRVDQPTPDRPAAR